MVKTVILNGCQFAEGQTVTLAYNGVMRLVQILEVHNGFVKVWDLTKRGYRTLTIAKIGQ